RDRPICERQGIALLRPRGSGEGSAIAGRAGGMTLWTAAEAEAATLGRATKDFAVTGISIDTRTLKAGDLFVALKGARDGHEFVNAAFQAKAAAAMVSRASTGSGALLTVAD